MSSSLSPVWHLDAVGAQPTKKQNCCCAARRKERTRLCHVDDPSQRLGQAPEARETSCTCDQWLCGNHHQQQDGRSTVLLSCPDWIDFWKLLPTQAPLVKCRRLFFCWRTCAKDCISRSWLACRSSGRPRWHGFGPLFVSPVLRCSMADIEL